MVNILLIDEEPSISPSVASALRSAGHEVTVAADGGEGISLASLRSFDAIVHVAPGQAHAHAHAATSQGGVRPLSVAVKEFEREYLLRALEAAQHRKARAADYLGISRKNLWEKLRAHGISTAEIEEGALGPERE